MKKIVIILGIVCAAFASNAAYLLWQVTDADTAKVRSWSGNECYNYVSVSYKVNGTSGALTRLETVSRADAAAGAISTDLSTFTSSKTYSIFVELWNYDGDEWNQVGQTESGMISYTAFAQNCTYIDAGFSPTTPQVWHGGTITVPEPTSGMMMMVGLALLAIKRRKA